jgi:hypothetical protein
MDAHAGVQGDRRSDSITLPNFHVIGMNYMAYYADQISLLHPCPYELLWMERVIMVRRKAFDENHQGHLVHCKQRPSPSESFMTMTCVAAMPTPLSFCLLDKTFVGSTNAMKPDTKARRQSVF